MRSSRPIIHLLCILWLPFLLFSCGKQDPPDHPGHFDPVFKTANQLFDSGLYEQCIRFVDSVFRAFPKQGPGDKIRKYNHIKDCNFKLYSNYDSNLLYTDSILLVLQGREEDYPMEHMRALLSKGDAYFGLKRYHEAYPYYYRAKLVAEKIDPRAYIDLYSGRLGNAYFREGRYNEALECYRKAVDVVSSLHKTGDEQYRFSRQQKFLNSMGLCHERAGRPDSALFYYQRALDVIDRYEKAKPEEATFIGVARGVIYGNMGSSWYAKGDTAKAEELLRRSIQINTQKNHDESDAQTAALKLARLYLDAGRLSDMQWILMALQTSLDSLPDNERKLKWLEMQWKFYDRSGDYRNTSRYIREYLKLYQHLEQEAKKLRGDEVSQNIKSIQDEYEIELLKKETSLQSIYLLLIATLSLMGILVTFLLWRNWKLSTKSISRLTELNEKIGQQNASLDQNNKDKDRTMKVLAHDLKNPLGGIVSLSNIMLDDQNLSADNRKMIQLINTSSRYATQMINDLLQASLGNQQVMVERKPADIQLLLQQCVNLLQFKAAEKDQQLVLESSDVGPVEIDAEKIQRVINNLIVNAVKFSPDGEKILLRMQRSDHHLTLSVEDHGIGIPDDLKEHVFDMFTTAKRFGTANEQPFGLGLAISRQIVEAHDGKIWFESTEGKGTIFYVELPLKD
jgi:signal transduction histidine kinase